MTIPQAIAELEDRDLPEVVELIKKMDRWLRENEAHIAELKAKISELEFGQFLGGCDGKNYLWSDSPNNLFPLVVAPGNEWRV